MTNKAMGLEETLILWGEGRRGRVYLPIARHDHYRAVFNTHQRCKLTVTHKETTLDYMLG